MLAGGSGYIETPKELKDKHAVVNIKVDARCFQYCLTAWSLNLEVNHADRPSHYEQYEDGSPIGPGRSTRKRVLKPTNLDFDGLGDNVSLCDIDTFEENNTISVYVYVWRTHNTPNGLKHRAASLRKPKILFDQHVELLLLGCESTREKNGHYVLVTNFNALMGEHGATSLHRHTRNDAKWCRDCMCSFGSEERLDKHRQSGECTSTPHLGPVYKLPDEGSVKRFDRPNTQVDAQAFFVADFECYYDAIPGTKRTGSNERVASYGYAAWAHPMVKVRRFHMQLGTAQDFLRDIVNQAFSVRQQLNQHPECRLLPDEEGQFQRATKCYLCGCTSKLVRDHDHLTGRFRGAACDYCNKQSRLLKRSCATSTIWASTGICSCTPYRGSLRNPTTPAANSGAFRRARRR
jgi:hypothetical protein